MPQIKRKSRSKNNYNNNGQGSNPSSYSPSVSEIGSEGLTSLKPRIAKRSQKKNENKTKKRSTSATPTASFHDGWNKGPDVNNNSTEQEQLLYPEDSVMMKDSSGARKTKSKKSSKQAGSKGKGKAQSDIRNSQSSSTISLQTQGSKCGGITGQIRQVFNKFGVDYEVPLQKKASRRSKRMRGNGSTSQQSVNDPYSNVLPKVDSRWKKIDAYRHILKINSHNGVDRNDKKGNNANNYNNNTPKTQLSERPSILKQTRSSMGASSIVEIPLKRQVTKREKFVTNYPASETVKNTKAKLPLTIPPKYNSKKVMELTRNTGRFSKVKAKKVPSSKSKPFFDNTYYREEEVEEEEQNSKIVHFDNFLNDSLLDIKQISNKTSSMMGRSLRAPMMGSNALDTSLQAAPSTFLAAKISIQRRMNKIRFSSEKDEIPTYNMYVHQAITTLPLLNNRHTKSCRSFPIPWPCSFEQTKQIMASSQKAFPLTKKNRKRKNTLAIGYANRIFPDDGGASSPINLLHRSSLAELDPEEATTIERRKPSLHGPSLCGLLSNKSSDCLISNLSVGRRSRSSSKHRVRISEVLIGRDEDDVVNGNDIQCTSQSSLRRLCGPSSNTNVSKSSSKSSTKSSKHSLPPVPRRKKKRSKPLGEFQRLHQVLSKGKVNVDEVDLFSARSLNDVSEKISAVNDAVIGGLVDIVKTVANLLTFNSFAQEEDLSENTES